MSTSAVFARGSEWGASRLYDGWGDNVTDEQAEALGDLAVAQFERWCQIVGDPSITWLPELAEVHGEVWGEDTDEHEKWDHVYPSSHIDLDDAREQAIQSVWRAVTGESTGNPVARLVAEILADALD